MNDKIDLGVNAGQVLVKGKTLSFKMTRFSNTRLKEEPLPERPAILDSYAFCLYVVLGQRALAMKGDSEPMSVAFPQGMRLRQATLQFMGIEKTPFHGEILILRHYDVNVAGGTMASFWIDKAGKVVQVSLPNEGLLASLVKYKPVPFEAEAPRMTKQAVVATTASFAEKTFRIPIGGVSLGATLTLPAETGTFPTILMIQDLNPLDRDGNDPANPYSRAGTWKQVAYLFATEGFATLRVDARGVGESGGSPNQISWDQRVGDIVALAAWLAQQPTTKDQKVIFAAQGLGGVGCGPGGGQGQARGLRGHGLPRQDRLPPLEGAGELQPGPGQPRRGPGRARDPHETGRGEEHGVGDVRRSEDLPAHVPGDRRHRPARARLRAHHALPVPLPRAEHDRHGLPQGRPRPRASRRAGGLVLPNLGHKLTSYDVEGYASGLVEAKNLRAAFDWLKKNG